LAITTQADSPIKLAGIHRSSNAAKVRQYANPVAGANPANLSTHCHRGNSRHSEPLLILANAFGAESKPRQFDRTRCGGLDIEMGQFPGLILDDSLQTNRNRMPLIEGCSKCEFVDVKQTPLAMMPTRRESAYGQEQQAGCGPPRVATALDIPTHERAPRETPPKHHRQRKDPVDKHADGSCAKQDQTGSPLVGWSDHTLIGHAASPWICVS
jgi:hypothetical protein